MVPLATSNTDSSPTSPPATTNADASLFSPPAPAAARSPPPASTTTPPSDSALAIPVHQSQASSVYSNTSPPVLQPVRPPDRSQTHTPASTSSTSGALSRTLSRLRERSRSLSSSRRSRSRPQSLVLLNSNHGSELKTVEDASPRPSQARDADVDGATATAAQSSRRGSEFGMAAISPWNEPDEATALGTVMRNDALPALPGRLGVLPSPAADTFSVAQESRPGTAEEAGIVQREISTGDQPRDLTEEPQSIESTVAETPVAETKAESADREIEDELYDITPKQANFRNVDASQDVDETTPTASRRYESTDSPGGTDPTRATDAEQAAAGAEPQDEKSNRVDTRELGLPSEQIADVGAGPTGPRPEDESTDSNVFMERSGTDLLAVPAIAEPSSTQDWDERSGVSSNNEFHDAQDEPGSEDKQSSRRSSVSSLGQDDVDSEQPAMSSQAVPAGPSPEQSTLKPDSGLMNRPYQYEGDGRSKSYIALGTDDSGAPRQESLDIAKKPEEDSYEFINFGDSRVGGASVQRQPAVRDASGASRPRRFSGMVKGRTPTLTSPDIPNTAGPIAAPAASAISDQYGLEGVQNMSHFVVGEASPERAPDKQEEKKAKRKSGLFDAFKRSPSITKTEFSRESGPARLDSRKDPRFSIPAQRAIETRAVEPPKSMGKTPQRASTTAKEPEQKKKRFSGLGSIFGRSSTTGHKSEKPARKLTKAYTPSIESSQRQATAPLPNSEARETWLQQQRAEQRERQPNTYPPPSLGPPSNQYSLPDGNMFKSPEDMIPPQGSWYAPRNQRFEEQNIPHEQPPQYRPLHNDIRRDSPLGQVPESLRPVERSFSRPVRPVRPPLETDSYSPPTSPVSPGVQSRQVSSNAQSEYDQRPAYGPPPDRHASYRSNESEISGQSEWQRSEWRRQSSSPSISPVQTRPDNDAFPPGRGFRVGSITEEMARSPAREYNDQQTPWAITLPRPGEPGSRRPSRGAPYGMQGPPVPPQPRDYAPSGIGYAEAYPPPARWQNQRGLPMSPESPRSSLPMQQSDSLMSHAPVLDERPQRGTMRPQANAYPSPPVSPESQWFYNRAGLNPPPQMQYHAQSDDMEMPPPPRKGSYVQQRMYSYENEPPPAQPRRTSGYTGRRDDPTVSEEGVEMRGVSYPGQEWMPERWD